MAAPTTYASAREYVGLAVEQTPGTAVVPAITMPIEKCDPFDNWTWIDDVSTRGSMTDPYFRVQGVGHSEFALSGPAYFDSIGYLINNMMGDATYSATYTGSGTTTLSSGSIVGATTISTVASIPNGTLIQIDTGVNAEIRTTSGVSGGGPFSVTVPALSKPHNSAVAVKPVTTPNSQFYSLLNSGNGQPSTLTITDYQGPTASTGTRAYSGCVLSDLTLKGTMDTTAIMYDASGMGWPSAAAAAFTSNPTAVPPQASWETQVGLAGTVGSAPIKTINDFSISLKRVVQPYYTAQNLQVPYSLFRGKLTVSGTLNFVVSDESALTYLNSNTQPQLQLIISNGLAGSSLLSMQIDMQQAAWNTSKISRGNPAVEYAVTFDGIANTTNAGYSAGYSPLSITMQNSISAGSF